MIRTGRLTDKERAKRAQLTADYLAFRVEHKRAGTGDEVRKWLAARDQAELDEREARRVKLTPEQKQRLRMNAANMMVLLARGNVEEE